MPRRWPLFRVLFAAGVLAVVLARVDPGAAMGELRRAPAWAFVVPIALLLVASGLHAVRLRLLLPTPRPGLPTLLRIVLLGNFFGLFLPTGGADAAKVVALAQHAGGLDEAAASLGVVRALELLPWALFVAWGAAGVLPGRLPEFVPLAWLAALGLAGGFAVAVATVARGDTLLAHLPPRIARLLAPLARVRAAPGRLVLCFVLAFPYAFLNAGIVWALLVAYRVPLAYGTVLGLIPTVDVAISLPLTVSGLGIREGLFVHSFAAWHIPEAVALAIAFDRWTGELGRAVLGGVLFAISPNRRQPVTARHERDG